MGAPLGKLLSAYGMRVLPEREHRVLMPVPLHRHRLRERGYNQSLLLARHLAQHRDMAVMPEGLCRHRRTIPQTSLSGRERRRNLRNAFSLGGVACEGLHVLLIDDVFTSGATVNECARVLKRHGAACVDVLTLARRQ
ncbi:MAG: ComF family protein [Deltaproteobacteria bacterium]|nr:ComF family protein [Deltaproteobacteria bacterium]